MVATDYSVKRLNVLERDCIFGPRNDGGDFSCDCPVNVT